MQSIDWKPAPKVTVGVGTVERASDTSERAAMSNVDADLRTVREAIVHRHVEAELKGDFDAWSATFAPGRLSYDLPAIDALMGEAEMRSYLMEYFANTTGNAIDIQQLHHCDDAVILEVVSHGIALDPSAADGLGKTIASRQCVIFRFDGDQLWQESCYGAADWVLD
jgi:hypothetical protein